jgi:hypothetical protein
MNDVRNNEEKMKRELEIAGIIVVIGENVRAALLIGDRSSTCST